MSAETDVQFGQVAGKVALITGAARGQGRSHAVRLAEEGADIIAVDVPRPYTTLRYPLASDADLEETADMVRELGRRIVAVRADVRDADALHAAAKRGVDELGRIDIVCANAAGSSTQHWNEISPQLWQEIIDTNITGVWNTARAAIPHLVERGGVIICISSTGGLKGLPFLTTYVASKFAVVGIAKSLANELARHKIRVNTIHPTGIDTPMAAGLDLADQIAQVPELASVFANALPVGLLPSREVSNAVLFLASDEARYVTGQTFAVDAGCTNR